MPKFAAILTLLVVLMANMTSPVNAGEDFYSCPSMVAIGDLEDGEVVSPEGCVWYEYPNYVVLGWMENGYSAAGLARRDSLTGKYLILEKFTNDNTISVRFDYENDQISLIFGYEENQSYSYYLVDGWLLGDALGEAIPPVEGLGKLCSHIGNSRNALIKIPLCYISEVDTDNSIAFWENDGEYFTGIVLQNEMQAMTQTQSGNEPFSVLMMEEPMVEEGHSPYVVGSEMIFNLKYDGVQLIINNFFTMNGEGVFEVIE